MDAEFYERKIKEMLHDTKLEGETDHNKDRKTISLIKQLISNTESDLTDKEQDYITEFECKTSTFYGLLKFFQYITHVHFYKIKIKYVDANLDVSDNAISGNEPSSKMLTSQSQIPE